MYAEPAGFDRRALMHVLTEWGIEAIELRYEPVGFGTHHYRVRAKDGQAWFVNVDELSTKTWWAHDDAFAALEGALRATVLLRNAGLEFVHAPSVGRNGSPLAPLAGGYAVSVYSVVHGESHRHGDYPTNELRRRVLAAIGRLHASTKLLPAGLLQRDRLRVPLREPLIAALANPSAAWSGGPYSTRAEQLVLPRANALRALFTHYDELAQSLRANSDDWVVTHGEPHAANVMRTTDGAIRLIDWDTMAIGPRERDRWMLEPLGEDDSTAYTASNPGARIDPEALAFYRLQWTLSEICTYTATFRGPHVDDENTRLAWSELEGYVHAM
ncbi:phosphotransferase [Pendulispora albinea]|uniref:Aminoglycoside phosphotransferase family protein n=1 Tax=Pendulispora albinea TaxID=2741071 RepID=A0ABZ2M1M9_9BACT